MSKKDNKEQTNKKRSNDDGFYRIDLRVSEDCCNSDSYGVGGCGRKLKK